MDDTQVGQIVSWVGLDVGKEDHRATVVSAAGERLFERPVRNEEAAIERLLERALESGPCACDRSAGLDRVAGGSASRASAACQLPACRGW
jgi:Transposase